MGYLRYNIIQNIYAGNELKEKNNHWSFRASPLFQRGWHARCLKIPVILRKIRVTGDFVPINTTSDLESPVVALVVIFSIQKCSATPPSLEKRACVRIFYVVFNPLFAFTSIYKRNDFFNRTSVLRRIRIICRITYRDNTDRSEFIGKI